MRRRSYPYGRYLAKDTTMLKLGRHLEDFLAERDFKIIETDERNEDVGYLIVAVNKPKEKISLSDFDFGHLKLFFQRYPLTTPTLEETDMAEQRVGVEVYLWPSDEAEGEDDVIVEVFVLPYMEHFNKEEIYGLTGTESEEVTDWYLCENIADQLFPSMEDEFGLEGLIIR